MLHFKAIPLNSLAKVVLNMYNWCNRIENYTSEVYFVWTDFTICHPWWFLLAAFASILILGEHLKYTSTKLTWIDNTGEWKRLGMMRFLFDFHWLPQIYVQLLKWAKNNTIAYIPGRPHRQFECSIQLIVFHFTSFPSRKNNALLDKRLNVFHQLIDINSKFWHSPFTIYLFTYAHSITKKWTREKKNRIICRECEKSMISLSQKS